MQQQGFFWHLHHEVLIEWCTSYDERAQYIRTQKPVHEQETRLRLFQPVRGELPKAVLKAAAAYDKAMTAYIKVRINYFRAGVAYDKARDALMRALATHRAEIEALHKVECLNCSWNGETIFP